VELYRLCVSFSFPVSQRFVGGSPKFFRDRFTDSICARARTITDIDPLEKWMFTASGSRGWDGNSTENLIIHEIVRD